MLKKLALLAGLLVLGGCATNSAGQVTVDGQTLQQIEAAVQQDMLAFCSFVPTASTLATVVETALSSGIPAVSIAVGITTVATNIATGVCQAIQTTPTPPPASLKALRASGAPPPVYCIGGKCVNLIGRVIH
jgi:hypothetical protein